jgi:tight adherence protein C
MPLPSRPSHAAGVLIAGRSMKGPLSDEIGRMLHGMQLGIRRTDAMRSLSDRTNVEELPELRFGDGASGRFRREHRERSAGAIAGAADEAPSAGRGTAMKIPVKLLFPMIACILPALLILVVGPGVIKIAKVLF